MREHTHPSQTKGRLALHLAIRPGLALELIHQLVSPDGGSEICSWLTPCSLNWSGLGISGTGGRIPEQNGKSWYTLMHHGRIWLTAERALACKLSAHVAVLAMDGKYTGQLLSSGARCRGGVRSSRPRAYATRACIVGYTCLRGGTRCGLTLFRRGYCIDRLLTSCAARLLTCGAAGYKKAPRTSNKMGQNGGPSGPALSGPGFLSLQL